MSPTFKKFLWIAGFLASFVFAAAAQPAVVTGTNYVTVMVTNIVTITNIVPPASLATPATPAAAAIAASIPPTPKMAAKFPWTNSISLGLTLARGNTETELATADFLTQKKSPFNEFRIELSAAYGDQNSKQTVNNYKASAQWNHLFTPRFYSYLRTDGLRDVIADVDYRVTIGPGVGYYLIKSTNTSVALEAGSAFEAQKLDGKGDQPFATLRGAEKIERKLNEHVRLWENAEILPQVDRWDNFIVNFEIGLETALTKSFSLKTYLDDNYDSRPAPGKVKNDAKIIAALGYKF